MKKVFSVFVLLVLCTTTVVSQRSKDVIIEIDGEPVYASEFTRVYLKNLDLVQKESQKDVDGYLDLFIDYKLKIAEASAQGLDQERSEEHTSELQSRPHLVCRLLLEKKKNKHNKQL